MGDIWLRLEQRRFEENSWRRSQISQNFIEVEASTKNSLLNQIELKLSWGLSAVWCKYVTIRPIARKAELWVNRPWAKPKRLLTRGPWGYKWKLQLMKFCFFVQQHQSVERLCTGQFQNRPSPPPGKPPGIWLFWKILVKFPAMLPVLTSPVRASKRVKSPTLSCHALMK